MAVFQFGGAVASGAAPFMVFERWPTVDGADTELTGPQHNRCGAAVGGGAPSRGPLVTSGMIGKAWAGSHRGRLKVRGWLSEFRVDLKRETELREFAGSAEIPAGAFLDTAQPVAHRVGVAEQLGGGGTV